MLVKIVEMNHVKFFFLFLLLTEGKRKVVVKDRGRGKNASLLVVMSSKERGIKRKAKHKQLERQTCRHLSNYVNLFGRSMTKQVYCCYYI